MNLFTPCRIGAVTAPNRLVMAPLARARCDDGRAPTEIVAEYYGQRATAGLIVTEATSVSPYSVSRPGAAAHFNVRQTAGWKKVAESVHEKGGRIFQQLYHLGRKSDPTRMPGGAQPVAPSPIAAKGEIAGVNGPVAFATPRELDAGEIAGVVQEFRAAAERSKAAGMDGVEIHGANCYLIDQFLRDGVNRRTDAYGGPVANRARFALEVVEAVTSVFGKDQVGIRLSPHARGDGSFDSDPATTYTYLANALADLDIAYIHLVEAEKPGLGQSPPDGVPRLLPSIRRAFGNALIVNGGYDRDSAEGVISRGEADFVAFGALFIANPDLPERFRRNAGLNKPDTSTFHHGGAAGYVDYPALA